MNEDKDILKQIGRHDGMTVPDEYFADFAAQMADKLEPTDFEQSSSAPFTAPRLSMWQRVRPYVYMAAMFAGIWCMLKLFTTLTSGTSDPFEPSPILAEALRDDSFVNQYIIDDIDRIDLMDQMMEDGFSFEDFQDEDFDTAPDSNVQ